jgi:peptidoglycan/LPS O-acetylase OafA/YrhL
MTETTRNTRRVGWLDGLRGIAAMQVVLLHYVSAFLPTMDSLYPLPIHDFWWRGLLTAPVIFLYDGHAAVYLFFIMSGVALTYAFAAHPFAILPAVMRRVIRLGLPMMAATILAAALYALLPDTHAAAADYTSSPWLRATGSVTISLASIAHQIVFEGLLTGFHGCSLLPGWAIGHLTLVPSGRAFDGPLWTLHIELCGSLLVMLLVAIRASISREAYLAACAILGCMFVLSPMAPFILGHVAANHLRHPVSRSRQTLGAALLGSGILLCSTPLLAPLSSLWWWLPPTPLGIPGGPMIMQKTLGAGLVFGGFALLPVLQRQLQRPALRRLGTISFSLYLVHLPLTFTAVAAGFIRLQTILPYGIAATVTTVAGIVASLALAVVFEHWVDRPAINLSRMIGRSRRRTAAPAAYVPVADYL